MSFDNSTVEASLMSVPCEVAVKCVLPVVRAMVAKELMAKYRLKQTQVAEILRVSQPAISLYCRKIRGRAIDLENDEDIGKQVRSVAEALAKKRLTRRDLIPKYCEICKTVRAKGLLCELHKAFDPTINIETCKLCYTNEPLSCM
jgi:predicted transcriptional regulator